MEKRRRVSYQRGPKSPEEFHQYGTWCFMEEHVGRRNYLIIIEDCNVYLY